MNRDVDPSAARQMDGYIFSVLEKENQTQNQIYKKKSFYISTEMKHPIPCPASTVWVKFLEFHLKVFCNIAYISSFKVHQCVIRG